MPKYKLKYKILSNGFPGTKEEYRVDGFVLKKSILNVDENSYKKNKNEFDSSVLIQLSCSYNLVKDNNLYYNFFENEAYEKISIPKAETSQPMKIMEYIYKYKMAAELIENLEKKLRLIFNIPVIFPMANIYIYDDNDRFVSKMIVHRDFLGKNRLEYFDGEVFFKNSHFRYSINEISTIEKSHGNFKRAMDFYYHSFDSSSISTRYILIFSALESLFNINREDIAENLGKFCSTIMCFEDANEKNKIYLRIKHLYNKRCDYIHGSKISSIKSEDEIELREYARKIIIMYMVICIWYPITDKKIIELLDSGEKLKFQVRMFAKSFDVADFAKLYKDTTVPEVSKEILNGNLEIVGKQDGVTQLRENK